MSESSSGSTAQPVAAAGIDQTKEMAGAATDQAKAVAGTASEGASQVASTVADQASRLTGEVASQGRTLIDETRTQLKEQAVVQTDRLGETLRRLSEEARALIEGRTDEAGMVGDYAGQAADKINTLASRVEEGGFEGVVDDLQRFARRRPGLFLLGAAAAGVVVGRMVKASRDSNADSDSTSSYQQRSLSSPAQTSGLYAADDVVVPSPLDEVDLSGATGATGGSGAAMPAGVVSQPTAPFTPGVAP